MNGRERVLRYFARDRLDRVPIDYDANGVIDQKLREHFHAKTREELLRALRVDFYGIEPRYTGPRLHPERRDRVVTPDMGIVMRWIVNDFGGYCDYCDFPLETAGEEEIAAYPLPSPDDYDYDELLDRCRAHSPEFSIYAGNPGWGCYINTNGFLRGMEQTFVDLATEDPAGILLAKRRFELELGKLERMLDRCREYVDFLWIGEDLGTQHTPLISMECYRKLIKPWHEKFIGLADSYHLPVMVHTCGSSSWVYPEFIEMGVRAVDTLQPEAADMSPACLKQRFGGKLCFHGCISTAGPVAYGTPEEVEQDCREILATMMPGYEYAFAPTHSLQDNSPLENVLRMYECALRYGRY